MTAITYETYQELGTGVRYYNMNLGHQVNSVEVLPSLNPFKGLAHSDIDETVLATLKEKLTSVYALLEQSSIEAVADMCDVSTQKVQYAYEGVKKALNAVQDAQTELNC